MKIPIKTLTALKKDIAQWKRFFAGKTKPDDTVYGSGCALCQLYLIKFDSCRGCPVFEKTHKSCFKATPYLNAVKAFRKYGQSSSTFKAAAKMELEFLQSLLPKNAKI